MTSLTIDARTAREFKGGRRQRGRYRRSRASDGHPGDRAGRAAASACSSSPRPGPERVVLFDQAYIQYFTGFSFLANERPVAFAQNAAGESAVFVPEFEVERARAETDFERVESYPEYPGTEHPMLILARVLADLGIRARSAPTATATRGSSATRARRSAR